jgi:plasmid stabilization system protein ParE
VSGYYLTPKAAEGIESIWDYIAAESGVRRADKVVEWIWRHPRSVDIPSKVPL